MSEMFRPAPPSAAPNHDQHDPLLVAQAVAGDALEPAREQEARAWLATCPACTQLAADLRAVSVAVASEPVPPRRRDFRLGPEQAEALRGDAFTRFLRRFSLPRTRAFAPAAAGIMSIGLVFVVAGYAWPDDGPALVATDAEVVPAAELAPAVTPLPAAGALPAADLSLEQATPAGPDAVEYFAGEPELLESLTEDQAGTSLRSESMQKSFEAESLEASLAQEAPVEVPVDAADEVADRVAAEPNLAAQAPTPADAQAPADPQAAADAQAEADTMAIGASEEGLEPGPGVDDAVATGATASDGVSPAGDGVERWLLLVGAALAVAGGALLLLGWLSRRTMDPLLR